MTAVIEARGLAKVYGATRALDGARLRRSNPAASSASSVRNGAGKTTALKAILGLTPFQRRAHRLDSIRGIAAAMS